MPTEKGIPALSMNVLCHWLPARDAVHCLAGDHGAYLADALQLIGNAYPHGGLRRDVAAKGFMATVPSAADAPCSGGKTEGVDMLIYRRQTYRVCPDRAHAFTSFFHDHLLPLQRKHGGRLVGRWVTEDCKEVMALWEYRDREECEEIEQRIRADKDHVVAQARRAELEPLFESSHQDFLTPTGDYAPSTFRISVAGYITNPAGEVLLVRTTWRQDTWECPGGQVERGETLSAALRREVLEETGIEAKLMGVTGVYHNLTSGIVAVAMRGRAIGGQLRPSPETPDVKFVPATPETLDEYVTRPHFKERILDAMRGSVVAISSYHVRPYSLVDRVSPQNCG